MTERLAVDKFRILFPLEKPFELAPHNPALHRERCAEWRERLSAFAANMLDLKIDASGCDVNRLFYTPRHKPSNLHAYSAIFAGRGLCIEDMPYVSSGNQSKREARQSQSNHPSLHSNKQRPILSDGFDLIDWHREWGEYFLVREFFDYLQWDIGRDDEARKEARILCPNDHAHSSPDDLSACWIKDGTAHARSVIYCHHNSCSEMGTLDQLLELEEYVDLPDAFSFLSELLCDLTLYCGNSDRQPKRCNYLRWDCRGSIAGASSCAEQEAVQ